MAVMQWILIFVCILAGLHKGFPLRYHFVNMEQKWSDAQSYCRKEYTDLATIENLEEMEMLTDNVETGYSSKVWIGLEKGSVWKWQWSLPGRCSSTGDERKFCHWDDDQPRNMDQNRNCVLMGSNGTWSAASCDSRAAFVCCEAKHVSEQKCILVGEEKTWREAQSYCRDKHGDLVTVRNQGENKEIWTMIQNASPKKPFVWIGLFRDPWEWSGRGKSSFRYWRAGEPNNKAGKEKCVEVWVHNKRWNDESCLSKRPFFCYSVRKRHIVRVELIAHADFNMHGAGVKEASLQQIQEKLREHGVLKDYVMQWREQPDGKIFHLKEGRKLEPKCGEV